MFGASQKNLGKNQFASYTYISIQRDLFLRGYTYLYGRCTNKFAKKIMEKFGGECINMLTIEGDFKMYLIETDLDKPL
jgi:hypothetical protein